jgi:hypothetical protein
MADTAIFRVPRLLLTYKLLMKIGSLPTKKSSPEPSTKADAEIFSVS